MCSRTLCTALVMCGLGAVAGCSESKGNVSGTVTYEGAALPAGKVTFICEGGNKPVILAEIHDGKYEMKGVPVGPVKITVATYKPSQAGERPPGLGPTTRPGAEESPRKPNENYVAIPPRYGQMETSGLTYDVKPGDQEFNIPLTP